LSNLEENGSGPPGGVRTWEAYTSAAKDALWALDFFVGPRSGCARRPAVFPERIELDLAQLLLGATYSCSELSLSQQMANEFFADRIAQATGLTEWASSVKPKE
jgi:hypothetical protein